MIVNLKLHKRRSISSVIGSVFFLIIMGFAFTAFTTMMTTNSEFLENQLEISQLETNKIQEAFTLTTCVNDFDNQLFVEVTNNGQSAIEVRDVWMINNSQSTFPVAIFETENKDAFVAPGTTRNVLENKQLFMNVGDYDIKAITSIGTAQRDDLTVNQVVSEGSFKGIFTEEDLDEPTYLTVGPAPNYYVYVSSEGNDVVNKYEFPSGDKIINVFINLNAGLLDTPMGTIFGPTSGIHEDLYIISSNDDIIQRWEGGTGDLLGDYVDLDDNGGLNGGFDLVFGTGTNDDGVLYVSDTDGDGGGTNDRILSYDAITGAFSSIYYDENDTPPIDKPRGLAIHPTTGDLFVANDDDNNILQITAANTGTEYYSAAATPPLDEPYDITFNSTGHLFVANQKDENIIVIDPSTQAGTIYATKADNDIDHPHFLAISPTTDEDVYITQHDKEILKFQHGHNSGYEYFWNEYTAICR